MVEREEYRKSSRVGIWQRGVHLFILMRWEKDNLFVYLSFYVNFSPKKS